MSKHQLTRREILQAAGGITFLAATSRSLAAFTEAEPIAPEESVRLYPVFTALPYLQSGRIGKLVDGEEEMVIAWQTDAVPAKFHLTYGPKGTEHVAELASTLRSEGYEREKEKRINHVATLTGLQLGTKVRYRVQMDGERLIEGFFTTRKPRGRAIRFVAFGDNSVGDISDRAIAFESFRARPDFVMNTGDLVYSRGLENEYARFFFPNYNADEAGRRIGAPLLRSVPLYTVMANHDINGRDPGGHPAVNFDTNHDALGYFTNLHHPQNGPARLPTHTPLVGNPALEKAFREVAGPRFPRCANYSFDVGDAHFTCLDSNTYVDPRDPDLQAWLEQDLAKTDALWKFVVYHHPAFNAGSEHYTQQHMRVLTPLLERLGVDMVLNGHEHIYQRSMPFRFEPGDTTSAGRVGTSDRLIPGTFRVDREFDGKTRTQPDGVLYITTGAGGNSLYDAEMNNQPERWLHPEDGNVAYVAKMITDRHSLTVFDIDGKRLVMRQVDEWGQEIDRIVVTK